MEVKSNQIKSRQVSFYHTIQGCGVMLFIMMCKIRTFMSLINRIDTLFTVESGGHIASIRIHLLHQSLEDKATVTVNT